MKDQRIAGMDGLRAISALLVLLLHAKVSGWTGGLFGVDVFFVLSGFLITKNLLDERARHGRINLLAFYKRRAVRLVPPLFAMMAVMVPLYLAAFPTDAAAFFRNEVLPAGLYLTNLWLLLWDQPRLLLGHTWTLAIEEQFYIAWPLALLAIVKLPRRDAALVAFGLACACAGWRAWLSFGLHIEGRRVVNGFDVHCDGLLIGAAIALASPDLRRQIAKAWPLALAGALYTAGAQLDWAHHSGFAGGAFAFVVCVGVLIAKIETDQTWFLTRALSVKPLAALGLTSYAFYLWHAPIMVMLQNGAGLTAWPLAGATLVLSALAAGLSWQLIEQPLKRGQRRAAVSVIQAPSPAP